MTASAQSSQAGACILIVDDETAVAGFLRRSLQAHGYRTLEAVDGQSAVRMASQYLPDLILLDLGLPDIDGLEVTRRVRSWSPLPILVLSARGLERQKVEALDAGADDYLTKPFGVPELLARIRAALRRAQRAKREPGKTRFRALHLEIDFDAHRVSAGGKEVHLTPIEFKLLALLAQHAGKVVTQKQLLLEVWGPGSAGQSQYLRVYMTHLRRKLEHGDGRGALFSTEAGVGYRLVEEDPEAGAAAD